MKSGERVALKENDGMTTLPKRNGSGRASRTAAGNSEIKVVGCFGYCHRIAKARFREIGAKASGIIVPGGEWSRRESSDIDEGRRGD
jgi:hypothetical protein